MIADTSGQDRALTRKRRPGYALWILIALVLAGVWFTLPAMRKWSAADRSFDRAKLRFGKVMRGDLVSDISVEGRIIASSYPTLYSPASGRVTLAVKAGQEVKPGELLAQVDSPELASQMQQEASSVAALEAALSRQKIQTKTDDLLNQQDIDLKRLRYETAQRAFVRAESSFEKGLLNAADFEAAEDEVKISALEFKNAKANAVLQKERLAFEVQNQASQLDRQKLVLQELQRRIAELAVRSPVDGVVGSISVDPTDVVIDNQPLLTVIDLSAFEITIDVPEVYGDKTQPGTTAEVRYENQFYPGMVIAISPEVNQSMVRGTVVFQGKPPTGLKQNQRVSVRMILATTADVLKVRRGPFLEAGAGREVFIVHDQIATRHRIQIGDTSISEVEIRQGLEEGDLIIISDVSRFDGVDSIFLRN